MWLLDTNAISELRKGRRCNAGVRGWVTLQEPRTFYFSVLSIGEIRFGIESLRARDPHQSAHLEIWLNQFITEFGDRLLPVTREIADRWGRLGVGQRLSTADALMAATAQEHHLTVVTRNVADFQRSGVAVLNPFS